jgi:hypothetical protein
MPELSQDPLSDLILDFLIAHDREEPYLDFKLKLDLSKGSAFPEIAKDILAFGNYGGGYILLGFRDRVKSQITTDASNRQFIPVGLPSEYLLDQADLQAKVNAYLVNPISISYREFHRVLDGSDMKLAILYVPPAATILKAAKSGRYQDESGKTRAPFVAGEVLFRRGTQSVKASRTEIEFIRRRAQNTAYQLSVLSGEPDHIEETIFSNLFEVVRKPDFVYSAYNRKTHPSWSELQIPLQFVSISWENRSISFDDLGDPANPIWQTVEGSTVMRDSFDAWQTDSTRRPVLVRLLNKEMAYLARMMGLEKEFERYRYFYPCNGDSRTETWKPRFRDTSQLAVARRIHSQRLTREVFIHLAVNAQFTVLDDRIFLQLVPTLVLTEDGRKPIYGEREGAMITSLLHNKYNQSYLNSLLFWAFQFSQGTETIKAAGGRLVVSSSPSVASVRAGILADRPAAEELSGLVSEARG